MGKKKNKKAQDEEVDLIKIFSLIGNAFSSLFNFIEKLFKKTFHYTILLLIFIKNNLKNFGIAAFLGIIFGFFIDVKSPDIYAYDMIFEPNYGSRYQVMEKVEYYNVLIDEKDSITLSKEFEISYEQANSLVEFKLKPYETETEQILEYNELLKQTDTVIHKLVNFKGFREGKLSLKSKSKRYVYRLKSTLDMLPNFKEKIIFDIEKNPTLQKEKKINLEVLTLNSQILKTELKEVDSLRKLYRYVKLLSAEKERKSNGTYIDFSKEGNTKNDDIKLFDISETLNKKIILNEIAKKRGEEIINIITEFNSSGKNITALENSYKVIFASIFVGFVLIFLLLKKLNKFLINYKKNK